MVKEAWGNRAERDIAFGASNPETRLEDAVKYVVPSHINYGKGAYLYTATGNKYLDFIGSGSVLGVAHDALIQPLYNQINKGVIFSLSSQIEVEAEEKVKEIAPFIDHVRFFKTKKDVVADAIAIGMAAFGTVRVIEPGDYDQAGLHLMREIATQKKECLIFDETRSTFRFPKFTASGYYGVNPDLIILGGALGGGFPIFAIGGKATTLAFDSLSADFSHVGETLSLRALVDTIKLLQTRYKLDELWESALDFQKVFNAISPEIELKGNYPTRLNLLASNKMAAAFKQECAKAGMIFGDYTHMTFPLAKEWKLALGAIKSIINKIKFRG